MRESGLILVRTGCYVTLGVLFGMLAFARTNAHKRRTGRSPWHIHPLVWGVASVFVTFLVTLLSIVYVAIFGTLVSVIACSTISQPSREPGATAGSGYRAVPGRSPVREWDPAVGSVQQSPPVTALKAWLPDPTGRHELRYFDGSGFTEHVADAGVISVDRS
jgi:hypothetical protein